MMGLSYAPLLDGSGLSYAMGANLNQWRAKMPTETDQERADRTALSSVRMTDEESAAVQKTPNRVSLDSMLAKVFDEEYIRPESIEHMTICILVMENGFAVVGKSAPADAENFDEELGKKFAKEDCIRQLWALEGYALREKLAAP
jgi:Phage protein (N4 Gp49/phage Sf6 gene 66) family